MEQADFDWGEKGEAFWRDLAAQCHNRCGVKATEQQLRFFVTKHSRHVTNAYAAQLAGARGRTANAGFRLFNSTAFKQLENELALDGAEVKYCDRERRKLLLSRLAETGSPSDSLGACRALEAIEEDERKSRENEYHHDPLKTLDEIAEKFSPLFALQLAAKHNCPFKAEREDLVADLRRLAQLVAERSQGGPSEAEDANGHSVTNGAAQQASAEQHEAGAVEQSQYWDGDRVPWKGGNSA